MGCATSRAYTSEPLPVVLQPIRPFVYETNADEANDPPVVDNRQNDAKRTHVIAQSAVADCM